ncbi:MAG: DUF4260 family protein [Gaiellaceae bacterium]
MLRRVPHVLLRAEGAALGAGALVLWLAHIGIDRLLGYGLKYPDRFRETHLQRL